MEKQSLNLKQLNLLVDIFKALDLPQISFVKNSKKITEEAIPNEYSEAEIGYLIKYFKKSPDFFSYVKQDGFTPKVGLLRLLDNLREDGYSYRSLRKYIKSENIKRFGDLQSLLLKNLNFITSPIELLDRKIKRLIATIKIGPEKNKVDKYIPGIQLLIPTEFPEKYREVLDEFKESAKWYNDIREIIESILEDEESSTLLAIIAITSAQNALANNILLGIDFYLSYKDDIQNRNQLFKKFFFDFIPAATTYIKQTNPQLGMSSLKSFLPYFSENFEKFEKYLQKDEGEDDKKSKSIKRTSQIIMTDVWDEDFTNLKLFQHFLKASESHIPSLYRFCKAMIETSNGFMRKDKLISILKDTLKSTGALKGDFLIGKYKIFNFALNLLTGGKNFSFDINNSGIDYIPATIDTWMIRLFYQDLPEKEKHIMSNEDLSAIKLKVFGNTYNLYSYMHRKLNTWASQLDMHPEELQAILWVYIYCKHNNKQGKEYSFLSVLDESLEKVKATINNEQKYLAETKDFLSKLKNTTLDSNAKQDVIGLTYDINKLK